MGLSFANKITVGRILAVPFFIVSALYYMPEREWLRYAALGIFLFAVISDVIDGYIARTRNQKTTAGAILDPLADKILLISAFLCSLKMGVYFESVRLPMWLVLAVISRDIILIIGAMIIHLVRGELHVDPTRWGKATTFFQVVCVLGFLLQWEFSIWVWPVTCVLTIISGVGYIKEGIKILNDNSAKHNP